VLVALIAVILSIRFWNDSRSVSLTVEVTPPDPNALTLDALPDRVPYADDLLRVFLREPESVRTQVATLFVPLDAALDASLLQQSLTIEQFASPSALTRKLIRRHGTSISIRFDDLVQSRSFMFTTLAGQELEITFENSDGSLYIVRPDGSRIRIVATEVYVGELIVYIIESPINVDN
jgi:hypothetical protein